MKEMVGGCCVCSDERGWPENPLVYCDGQNCTVAVHQACYGIVTVPTGPWYCRKCESQERSTRVRCELCPSRDGALKKTDNQGWAHVVCALYIPEVRFGNVTTMEPIILQLIPQERYTKICYICQEIGKPNRATVGACMQCNKSNCKQQFHVTCAQSLGLLCEEAGNYLDNVKYCGYCQHHYSKLKKGGNVKTIPPYKPITHDTSSDSSSSPEKEINSTVNPTTSSSISATSIKITTNFNVCPSSSSVSSSTKQRKSSTASKSNLSSTSSGVATSHIVTTNSNPSGGNSLHVSNNAVCSVNVSSDMNLIGGSSSCDIGNCSGGVTNSSITSGSGGVDTASVTSLKSNNSGSSSNSSNYKEKEKHSKINNKISSVNKDKDGGGNSTGTVGSSGTIGALSRESREKSSKPPKNKDVSSITLTSTSFNRSPTGIYSPVTDVASTQNVTSTLILNSLPVGGDIAGNCTNNNNKDNSKPISSSSIALSFGYDSNNETSASSFRNTFLGTVPSCTMTTNSSTTTISTICSASTCKSSSNNSFAKKRKVAEPKPNLYTDDVSSSNFRDIIKDVTVTLTPLQQTDFEKEIERSSKKQKTELQPSTYQSSHSIADTKSDCITRELGNTTNTANITPNIGSISTTTTTSGSSITSSTSPHKYAATQDTKVANSLTVTSSASGLAVQKNCSLPSSSSNNCERHGPKSIANSTAVSTSASGITLASTSPVANAPSLCVSVPLSTANVPGINLSSTTNIAAPTISDSANQHAAPTLLQRSTAATTDELSPNQLSLPISTSASSSQSVASSSTTLMSERNNNLSDRLSPHISRQSPTHSGGGVSFNTSATVTSLPSNIAHGVIYQSGKSPSSIVKANRNALANKIETGNLQIGYDKSISANQIQDQEPAPIQRIRTPDSGVFNTSSVSTSSASSLSSTISSSGTATTLNNVIGSGLKFSYEAQTAGIGMTSSGNIDAISDTSPIIETSASTSTTIKDSPPSSPGSEASTITIGGSVSTVRKRGRKTKDISTNFITTTSTTSSTHTKNSGDLKDVKVFQNGIGNITPISTTATTQMMSHTSAAHMLGNQLNPNSNVAQKLSDQLHMEMQEHSIYTPDAVTPQFVGVPFPGKRRNSSTASTIGASSLGIQNVTGSVAPSPGSASSLASMFGSGVNGNLSIPQSLEQLLERQWEQGSQFLMEQAQHFDIASLLSCLHQLQSENVRLEEHVTSLIARRDHLLAVNARLAIPLNTGNTTATQNQSK